MSTPKEKMIVLRGRRTSTKDIFLGPTLGTMDPLMAPMRGVMMPAAATSVNLSVHIEEVKRSELPRLTQEVDVLVVAPAVPMRLIEPVATKAAPAAAPAAAWGIEAVKAHTSPFSGSGIVVAVLDTGIEAGHPAFDGVIVEQKDFTGAGNGDTNGHGTHCAGTIFGRAVNGTRIGVAPGIQRALIGKVLSNNGGSDQVVQAIQWATDQGACIISMSLGIDFPGLQQRYVDQGMRPEAATSQALEGYRATVLLFERLAELVEVQAMFRQPCLLVAASGNESRRPTYEISVSPPAVASGIVSVAALGSNGPTLDVADFSNTGANIAGPGVDILSAGLGGGLTLMSGTSMATPHVAGVAALWAQKYQQMGVLTQKMFGAGVLASASLSGLRHGIDLSDIGGGLVQAPQQ